LAFKNLLPKPSPPPPTHTLPQTYAVPLLPSYPIPHFFYHSIHLPPYASILKCSTWLAHQLNHIILRCSPHLCPFINSTVFSPCLFQTIYSTSHHLLSLFPLPQCLFTSFILRYHSYSTQMFITSISPLSLQIIQFL